MVQVNYQAYGTATKLLKLRLRFYKDGETRYVNVNKKLFGNLQRRHWNVKKQMLTPKAPFSDENNRILYEFKKPYAEAAEKWDGTLSEFMLQFTNNGQILIDNAGKTLEEMFQLMIGEKKDRKHADGTTKGTYEMYVKAEKMMLRFCESQNMDYQMIRLSDITETFLNNFLDWVSTNSKGIVYCSMAFHALLMKADRGGWFDFKAVRNCKWKGKYGASKHKHESLTREQCEQFARLTPCQLPKSKYSELFQDFCLFMLSTGQSPCDAISLKYSQIQHTSDGSYLIFKRRKISEVQRQPCNVPINADMQRIIEKWRKHSKDGYVFPIRNKTTMRHPTNNYDIKKFVAILNVWLKKVGKILNLSFPLHTYVFRHTAITGWISQGVDLIYVANTAGTSVRNCESIYYDNMKDTRNHSRFLNARNF